MEIRKTMDDELIASMTTGTNVKTLDHIWPIVIIVNRDNRIVFLNRKAKRSFGIQKGEIIKKGGRYRLLPPDKCDD